MALGLSVAIPLTASAEEDPFLVIENPVGADYWLNQTAVPLKAVFDYDALADRGTIDSTAPIVISWYWSYENSDADRSNLCREDPVEYGRRIRPETTLMPATDEVGVKYYFAVLSYSVSVPTVQGQWDSQQMEAVTAPARVVVRAPEPVVTEPEEHGFRVRKTDDAGNPLAGAVISLSPDSIYQQDASVGYYEATSGSDGYASFSATDGYYVLEEKQAPAGYNATDEKYFIFISANGVYLLVDPRTQRMDPYETVTFVNKEIPTLNKEDHFAFMQGYPDGTFLPSRNMTRAEAVVMFKRLLTKSMNESTDYRNDYYPDVPHNAWYANEVCYMQQLGVLADYSRDGLFRPNDPVTRAEFATLAAHFAELTLTDTNAFSDVPGTHWAVRYINSAAAKGWITGYPDGTFKPEAGITRVEVVTLVGRMLDRAADSAYLSANAASLPRNYSDLTAAHWGYLAIMEASLGHDYIRDSSGEHWTAVSD